MNPSRLLVVVLTLIGSVSTRLDAEDAWATDQRNRDVLIKNLQGALSSAGGFGRFYYSGRCSRGGPAPAFPNLRLQQPTKGTTGLAAVQELFEKERQVTVTRSRSAIVRIIVGSAPSAILQTKIDFLRFKPEERYTPQLALIAIEGAKDVEVAMQKLRFEHPVVVASIGIQYPMPGRPHLPASLKDVSLDEALDSVAKTFGGVVTYEECMTPKGQRFFSTDFFCVACR